MGQSDAAAPRMGPLPPTTSNATIDAKALSLVVERVFRNLEPWQSASGEDKHVDVVIRAVLLQSQRFKNAIDLSANTGQHGLALLAEGALFARAVARGKPIEEMRPDFGHLVGLASDGFDRLDKSLTVLSQVSGRFQELSYETGPLVAQATRFPDRKLQKVRPSQGLIGIAKEAGGAVMFSKMPAHMSLSQPLPMIMRTNGPGLPNRYYESSNVHRREENLRLDEAIEKLKGVANDLEEVRERIVGFVDSWKNMRDKLAAMQALMRQNNATVGLQLGNEVGGDWADVVEQYKVYQEEVDAILHYYQIDFQVDFTGIDSKTILRKLEVHATAMRNAIWHMESIIKLMHGTGDGRRKFQASVDSMREKLDGHFDQLIPILESFKKSIKHFGGISDTEPAIRQDLVKLLGRTETYMPLAVRDIHNMGELLEEQVSNKRLLRAQFYFMFSSSCAEPRVYSLEDAMSVLSEFGDAALGVSRFCEILVLIGVVVVAETSLSGEQPRVIMEVLESAFESAIGALSKVKETLASGTRLHFV